jgi:hypothetical protein
MSERRTTRATITFQDLEVTASKDRLWHVEVAGRAASAEFLDQALEIVLPRLSYEDHDALLIQLLMATAPEPAR